MNYLYLFPNVARAYEILLPSKRVPTLVAVENGHGVKLSEEDMTSIADFFGKLHKRDFLFDPKTDAVIIEVPMPSADEILHSLTETKTEYFDDIRARAKAALPMAEVSTDLSSTCKSLLKTAISRLGLGLNDVQRIIEVSQLIAANAQSKVILPEHLAEAIQYKSVKL